MLSSVARLKNLSLLTSSILKTEWLNSSKSKRLLFTGKIILSNNKYDQNFRESNFHEYINIGKDPEDFGKIVSLDPDEVDIESEDHASSRSKKKKLVKKRKLKNEYGFKKEEIKQNDEIEKEGEFEKDTEGVKRERKKILTVEKLQSIGSVMSNLKSKKDREKEEKIILEGKRLIKDAINSGHKPLVIFFSRPCDIENFDLSPDTKLCQVPYKTIKLWSDVVTSQGVIAVFKAPKSVAENENSLPLTVICDNIREPGNMGCMIRILAAVGCKRVLLTKGCVDIWDPKTLRAGAGSHFKIPIYKNMKWEDIESKVPETSKVFMADCGITPSEKESENSDEKKSEGLFKTPVRDCIPLKCYDSVSYRSDDIVLVIGGETEGLSNEAFEFAEKRQGVRIHIPMSNDVASLNNSVALAVLSYEVRRQLMDESSAESQNKSSGNEEHQTVMFQPEPVIPMFS